MADDKTKRGSPDNKRLNKSEPYEMAYAKRKAAGKTGAAAKKSAGTSTKSATKSARKSSPRSSAKSSTTSASKSAGRSAGKSSGASARKAPGKSSSGAAARKSSPARKSAARARPAAAADGRSPRPTLRAGRAKGGEKNVANTAPAAKRTPDAIDLLTDDHLAVNACFKKYQKLVDSDASAAERQALAQMVCSMLKAHASIEEEIFYPAARAAGVESDLMDEADIEHASAKELIAQIEAGSPDAGHYDARVTVLGEYIEHHVVEEHTQMFTKCRRSGMELVELRAQLEARKAQLSGSDAPVLG